jgi:hypothetical protein
MLSANESDGGAYVFLVPDEGYSAMSLLHDRLYAGPFEQHHRLDIPYIPHMTVTKLRDSAMAKRLRDQLNRNGISIKGVLRALRIGALQDGRFIERHQVALGRTYRCMSLLMHRTAWVHRDAAMVNVMLTWPLGCSDLSIGLLQIQHSCTRRLTVLWATPKPMLLVWKLHQFAD